MNALVTVEERAGRATAESLAALALARDVEPSVQAVVLGFQVGEAGREAAAHGASRVYLLDDERLAERSPEAYAEVIAGLAAERGRDTLIVPGSTFGLDLAGQLAVLLDAGLNWDLAALRHEGGELLGVKRVFDDGLEVEVGWTGSPRIALVRPGVGVPQRAEEAGDVEEIVLDAFPEPRVALVAREPIAEDGADLEGASVIVAGGRGMLARENLALLEDLADALGGVVGVSRAVVELGWYPQAAQIGQTGKTVAPDLYVACGISGAIHHKVGMHRSGTIVAINVDRSAPIFDFCDVGVVGDATAIVPLLTRLLREEQAS